MPNEDGKGCPKVNQKLGRGAKRRWEWMPKGNPKYWRGAKKRWGGMPKGKSEDGKGR